MVQQGSPQGDERFWFERLQALLLRADDLPAMIVDVARVATTMVDTDVSCGVTLQRDDEAIAVGSSDERATAVEETQYRLGTGPCLQSIRDRSVIDVPDLSIEARWPAYTSAAVALGLRCVLCLPLTSNGGAFGAVNFYSFDVVAAFGASERRQLELFAAQTAGVLQVASRQIENIRLRDQTERALHSRTVIDQALGIVMARQGCTAAVAFDLLRRESQESHLPLREVAADLITRTTGAPPELGRPFDVG